MALFSRSTADNLAATRRSLADTEARIAALAATRAEKLLEAEGIADVQKLDAELATLRNALAIYGDRIEGLRQRQRQEERNRLEAEKTARIVEAEKRIANWQKAAHQVDIATAALQAAVRNLDAADDEIFGEDPYHRGRLSANFIEVLCERSAGPQDHLGMNEHRRIIGPLRRIAKGGPHFGLAEVVADRGRQLIEAMQAEPIAIEFPDDDSEAAA